VGPRERQTALDHHGFFGGKDAVASRSDIEAADWSLTPGRYVGVAPAEFDELIEPFVRQINCLIGGNQKLRAARDLLLPRLMSGEVAV